MKAKGWELSGANENMAAVVIRDGLECKLSILFRWFGGVPSVAIHAWASPHTEWPDDIDW